MRKNLKKLLIVLDQRPQKKLLQKRIKIKKKKIKKCNII